MEDPPRPSAEEPASSSVELSVITSDDSGAGNSSDADASGAEAGSGESPTSSFRRMMQAEASHANNFLSVSYELYDSELWNKRKIDMKNEAGDISHQKRSHLLINLAIFGIGVVVATAGFFIEWSTEKIHSSYTKLLGPDGIDTDASSPLYVRYLGFSLLFSLLSFLPVACFRPVATGSGISEAKAVLNGIKIPRCTELVSAACKGISVIFSVLSALPAGLEGPLIFIGMALGENAYRFFPRQYPELRSWRTRRDLAAIGTAAGVSVAFLSPIGGILFAAEEGASYITSRLLMQCFAAAITVVILDFFYSVVGAGNLGLSQPFALSLTRFNGLEGHNEAGSIPTFAFYDFFMISLVGVCGGVMGACFVKISLIFTKLRQKYIQGRGRKCLEVIILTCLAASLLIWLPTVPGLSTCRSLDNVDANTRYFVRLNCGMGEYNDLATLLRNPLPWAINLLFWENETTFSSKSCIVAGTTILVVLLLTFGATLSMGIFVPLLYIGAAFGRAFGTMSAETFDVRTYAIVGAAASLNGVVRVLVSLTVILMETTNLATFASPLMIVCLVSRYVGNRLFRQEGIYDEILRMRKIPFLEAEPPEITKTDVLRARDIMSKEFVQLSPVMRIPDILEAFQQSNDLDFIVTNGDGTLVGAISRASLMKAIWNKNSWIQNTDVEPESGFQDEQEEADISYHDYFEVDRMEKISNKELSDHLNFGDCHLFSLNIALFMSVARITFADSGSAERAYELFRAHGLRQLIIIDEKEQKPVGVITRYVLLEALEGEEHAGVSSVRSAELSEGLDNDSQGEDQQLGIS